MNERIWFGRVIQCATWDGRVSSLKCFSHRTISFFVLGKSKFDVSVCEDAEKQRLDEWHRYLTTEDD